MLTIIAAHAIISGSTRRASFETAMHGRPFGVGPGVFLVADPGPVNMQRIHCELNMLA
jgi:hypothetical protein